MKNHIIGIDPDTSKSGVAELYLQEKKLYLFSFSFFELYDYLESCNRIYGSDLVVLIEGGWMNNKSNFHGATGYRAQKVAKNVGSNHETGRKIIEMCEYLKIEYQVIKPLKKMWQGPGRKITHEELTYFTGYTSKTSQETRDAALIAWEHAGLPIRIPPRRK